MIGEGTLPFQTTAIVLRRRRDIDPLAFVRVSSRCGLAVPKPTAPSPERATSFPFCVLENHLYNRGSRPFPVPFCGSFDQFLACPQGAYLAADSFFSALADSKPLCSVLLPIQRFPVTVEGPPTTRCVPSSPLSCSKAVSIAALWKRKLRISCSAERFCPEVHLPVRSGEERKKICSRVSSPFESTLQALPQPVFGTLRHRRGSPVLSL